MLPTSDPQTTAASAEQPKNVQLAMERLNRLADESVSIAAQLEETFSAVLLRDPRSSADQLTDTPAGSDLANAILQAGDKINQSLAAIRYVIQSSDV